MPLIKKLLIALIITAGFFYVIGYFFPARWSVKRAIEIKNSAEKIYPYINDLHNWGQWYPWTKKMDVSLKIIYEGPETGPGSIRRWSGSSIKSGEIKIIKSEKNRGVWYTFTSEGSRVVVNGSLIIQEQSTGKNPVCRVTWEDTGDSGYNYFARFLSGAIDEAIGKNFEAGLLALKQAVEN